MKQRRLRFGGSSAGIIRIPAVLALLALAGAARADMAFQVKIKPTAPNAFEIRVKNETREAISGITMSIGSSTSLFLKLEQVDPGGRILEPAKDEGDVGLVRDVWTGLNSDRSIAVFSNQTAGFTTAPNSRELMTGLFESPVNVGDYYGQRIQGYFRPSVSGNYTFWITSDDESQLLVDGTAVAWVTNAWTARNTWTSLASQKSAPIAMTVGNSYHVVALMKESWGGDHVQVGITLPNGVDERPVKASRFSTVSGAGVPLPRPTPITNDIPADTIRITEINGNTGVTLGNELLIRGVFQQESGNAAKIMWNNGSQPNAKITVFGANGSRSELTIPDTDDNRSEITYTFLSEKRPRTLRVNSRTTSSQPGGFRLQFRGDRPEQRRRGDRVQQQQHVGCRD